MKKNLFIITENERERILGMHKNATNSQYLNLKEQEVPATNPATNPAPSLPADLKSVQDIQNFLLSKGYDLGPTGADNKMGPKTLAALGQFMTTFGKETKMETLPAKDAKVTSTANQATTPATDPKIGGTPQTPATAQTAPPVKPLATGGGSQPSGQAVTTQTSPQVSAELKSAQQIRQEFNQGKKDLRKMQAQRTKLYNTYNRLSNKMDKATSDSYLDNIAQLDKMIAQQ